MAAIGDRVLFNEGDADLDAWAVAFVVMTDTSSPGVFDHFNTVAGGYPETPDTGAVLLAYFQMVGNGEPLATSHIATPGTGPGQYQAL
jgi:hypothetical protein